MQQPLALAGVFSLALLTMPMVQSTPQVLDPVGSYALSTADETGTPVDGVLTIRAAEGGQYTGQFVPTGSTETVPVVQVTTNASHIMAFIETGAGLGVTWLERQEDGTFTGSWHLVGAAIRVTATKRTGDAAPERGPLH